LDLQSAAEGSQRKTKETEEGRQVDVGVGSTFDSIAGIIIAGTLVLGFWECGTEMGSVSEMIAQALANPQQFGVGVTLYYIGLDTWTPCIPPGFLDPTVAWVSWLYPFSGGYVPHYSLWSCLFSLLMSLAASWIFMHVWHRGFWFRGLLVAFIVFWISWYLWTLLAWHFMFRGGEMMGLTAIQVSKIWQASATATSSPTLQYFFMATIPISFIYLLKRVIRR